VASTGDAAVGAPGNLLIFGASTRAAAFSALRAGLRPWCADLFADADLQARCPVTPVPGRYPHGFLDLIDAAPPSPWMYTGGLENWPGLVREMARRRRLWGNSAPSLERSRNPWFVMDVLRAAGLPTPAVCCPPLVAPPSLRGVRASPLKDLPHPEWLAVNTFPRWLVKPLRGAGGAGIHFWDGQQAPVGRGPHYLQEFIEGEPCAAVYVGDGTRAWLLGLTRQLVGAPWLYAAPFRYSGNIGPLLPGPALRQALERLGTVLAARCGLCGLFGVDGVVRDEVFWPVEVNPRYTASVEVLEYATGLKALLSHGLLCERGTPPLREPPCVGKAILFARAALTFPADGPWLSLLHSPPSADEMPAYADIPHAGERIKAGRPVLTLFARAGSAAGCEEALRAQAADLDRWLFRR
jgi:predicted ATP-grasp superfamily ATP-dependent carboligase